MRPPFSKLVTMLSFTVICLYLNAQKISRSALSNESTSSETASAPATYPITSQRDPLLFLRGDFRFQRGDDPRWAAPDYDDSQWPLAPSDRPSTNAQTQLTSGVGWYRFSVVLPAGNEAFALRLPRIQTCYQLFEDGRLIYTQGELPPHPRVYTGIPALVPLGRTTRDQPQMQHLAIRVWKETRSYSLQSGGLHGPIEVGPLELLREPFADHVRSTEADSVADVSLAMLELVAAGVALVLFLFRRSGREYLWFSLLAFGLTVVHLIGAWQVGRSYPPFLVDTLGLIGLRLFQVALLLFLRKLFSAQWSNFLRFALLCACLALVDDLLWGIPNLISISASNLLDNCLQLPIFIWSIYVTYRQAWQRSPDARLLALPITLLIFTQQFSDIVTTFGVLGRPALYEWVHMYLTISHPLEADYQQISEAVFLLAMLAILVNRFSRATRNQDRIQSELEAARTVQRLLLPTEPPQTQGFEVESVYLPAQEVGGDFFHVMSREDASLLIIVGDVSGKGLSAAMSVSAIVGALRVDPTLEPAQILSNLSRALFGHISGFATCCAALISSDRVMLIANAGHLSPYRNGAELPLEGGLPLGLLQEVTYTNSSFSLQAGDRLTFISDGVVEAANRKGELFGFERTAVVSSRSAPEIAEAAKAFGQNDDITVLSVVLV